MPPAITSLAQLDPNGSYTYANYLGWKFQEFIELIRGQLLRPMARPNTRHQELSQRFEYVILTFLRSSSCKMFHAPFGVRLARDTGNGDAQIRTVVQPDIFVVCDKSEIDERGCLGAPDWIIEILSPGNSAHDTKTKFDLYEENGVREYWIVVPGLQTVQTHLLDAAGRYQPAAEYAEAAPMPVTTLPGLAVEWSEVFAESE
ncbi:MAG: Uma2 family endonuclease [Cytophagaceae bacterium]|nr:MAG: Uma2 family endonuclease [Cytophagaceae bacterium]